MSKQKVIDALETLPGDYKDLDLSPIGNKQVLFLFDIDNDQCVYISPRIEEITGHKTNWYKAHKSAHFIKRILHPEDFYSFYLNIILPRPHWSKYYFKLKRKPVSDTKAFKIRIAHNDGYWIRTKGKMLRIFQSKITMPGLLLVYFLPEELENSKEFPNTEIITSREKEILQLISNGYSSKMIATKLNISEETVVSHRKNLLRKFKAKNTAELIKMGMEHHQIGNSRT